MYVQHGIEDIIGCFDIVQYRPVFKLVTRDAGPISLSVHARNDDSHGMSIRLKVVNRAVFATACIMFGHTLLYHTHRA